MCVSMLDQDLVNLPFISSILSILSGPELQLCPSNTELHLHPALLQLSDKGETFAESKAHKHFFGLPRPMPANLPVTEEFLTYLMKQKCVNALLMAYFLCRVAVSRFEHHPSETLRQYYSVSSFLQSFYGAQNLFPGRSECCLAFRVSV